jgi:hypothetical protein
LQSSWQMVTCVQCIPECPTCFNNTINDCYSCAAPYFLNVTICQLDCNATGFYANTTLRKCMPCHPECQNCVGPYKTNCTSCPPTSFFLVAWSQCFIVCPPPLYFGNANMSCVLNCPDGQYGNAQSAYRLCTNCHTNCRLCYGGDYGSW